MDESRDDVAVFQIEVVVWPKDICGDDAGEGAAMLLVVGSVCAHMGREGGGRSMGCALDPWPPTNLF